MKIYGYGLLVLTLASALACSKGGDNSNSQPSALVNPNLNPYGLNQPFGYTGQNQDQNSIDIDMNTGKITNRQFVSLGGSGSQEITSDSCKPSLKNSKPFPVRLGVDTLGVQQNNSSRSSVDSLLLKFDANGVLTIQFKDAAGVITSRAIQPTGIQNAGALETYALDASTGQLLIGPFTLTGPVNASYINFILRSRGVSVVGNSLYNNPINSGLEFNGFADNRPANNGAVNSQSQISMMISGLTADIRTVNYNKRHIRRLIVNELQSSSDVVVASQNAVCATSYVNAIHEIELR